MTTPGEVSGDRPAVDGAGGQSAADPALAVSDLRKTFGSGEDAVQAVDGVSFAVEPGTVVGLLGPNGAGKTTTIKSILGLVVPDDGHAEVAGVDVAANPRAAYARVGAMLEGARNVYWKLTVRENLEFFAAVGGESPDALRERHDALLEQLSLAEKADAPVNDLSQGQKQKTSLACALARDVDVAFLDEPTLGLDVESSVELRREIRRLAEQEAMSIVLSSHDMDVVEDVCDRVVIMNDGRVIADDTVENLVDVFRSHAYAVTLDGPLPEGARERFRESYDAEFERRGDRERVEVTLGGPDRFYALVADLRETGRAVVDIESVEGLERVFLQVTNGDGAVDADDGGGDEGGSDSGDGVADEADRSGVRATDGGEHR